MSHIIQHTFECDVCGKRCPLDGNREHGNILDYEQRIVDPSAARIPFSLPYLWNFINCKLVCSDHKIQVEHNGDWVSLTEPKPETRDAGLIQASTSNVPLPSKSELGDVFGIVNRFVTPVKVFNGLFTIGSVPPHKTGYFRRYDCEGDWVSLGVRDV